MSAPNAPIRKKSRLVVWVVLPLVLLLAISGTVAIHAVHSENQTRVTQQLSDEARLASHDVEAFFLRSMTVVEVADTIPVFEEYFRTLTNRNQNIVSTSYYELVDIVDSIQVASRGQFLATWVCDLDTNYIFQSSNAPWVGEPSWTAASRPWYKTALRLKQPFLTSPYVESSKGRYVISVICPVLHKRTGEVIGVFGADISLGLLAPLMLRATATGWDRLILIAPDNTIVYHPDEQYLHRKVNTLPYSKNILDAVEGNLPGNYSFTFDGKPMQGTLSVLNDNQWVVLSELPQSTIDSMVAGTTTMLGVCFLLALALLLGSIFVVRKLLKSLEDNEAYLEKQVEIRTQSLIKQDAMLSTVNDIAKSLLTIDSGEPFTAVINESLHRIGEVTDRNRVYIWKDVYGENHSLCCTQVYEWARGVAPIQGEMAYEDIPYTALPSFQSALDAGKCLNSHVCDLTLSEQKTLEPQGILSLLIAPIIINGVRWGFIGMDNCQSRELFSDQEENMLLTSGFMLASAILKQSTELQLREAEELTQSLLDAMPLACNMWSEQCEPIVSNAGVVKLFGLDSREDFPARVQDVSPRCQPCGRPSAQLAEEHFAAAFRTGHCTFEWEHQNLQGESIPTHVTLVRLRFKNSNVVASYVRDLRELKAQEKQRREAEELVLAMFEATPLCCVVWSRQHDLLLCNEVAVQLFGLNSKQEFLECFQELSPMTQPCGSLSSALSAAYIAEAFHTGSASFEWIYQTLTGEAIPVHITLRRIKYQNADAVAGYVRDLRELKAKEAQRMEAEERTRLMLNAMPLCCNFWDKNFNNLACNDAAARLFDLQSQEEYLKCFQQLSPLVQPDGQLSNELALKLIAQAFEEGHVRFEWLHQKLDGTPIPCEITLVRMLHKDEHIVVGYTHDLRELKVMLAEVRKVEQELAQARDEAVAHSRTKSEFLAKMSHEIRTPMNAIVGMSELILREGIPPKAKEHALAIKQAGAHLLSIINDILDFSKIESGKLEINPSEYLFASLINDTINIIRVRMMEKPIVFAVNVDPALPNSLLGDDIRIRQVLLNVLNNAVKYTEEGFITLTVEGESIDADRLLLRMTVADSGAGIKEEDLSALFGQFVQFDSCKHKGVEGTGLGLAITRSLCRAMGGDIEVSSVYGEGSEFTITLIQHFTGTDCLATVEEPETKHVLLYEPRKIIANSIVRSLEMLAVPCTVASNQSELYERLNESRYAFIFMSHFLFETAKRVLEQMKCMKNVVVLTEHGEVIANKGIRAVSMPLYAINIANVLNGVWESQCADANDLHIRFIAPRARVLVVDDITTNLKVAEGLMAPYGMTIDLAEGGAEALEMVRSTAYDLVFMDHMMPGMNGIEATLAIRDMPEGAGLPIIALTANAVSGMREVFLSNGFNDFLAKPIETSKLNAVLERWVPKDKQEKYAVLAQPQAADTPIFAIEGVDVERGLTMTGGSMENYLRILATYRDDGITRVPEIRRALEEEDYTLYTTYVHALKSASASIGAASVSEYAKQLEAAAKREETLFVQQHTETFLAEFSQLLEHIEFVVMARDRDRPCEAMSREQRGDALAVLREALERMDAITADNYLNTLQSQNQSTALAKSIEQIARHVLMCEYDEAIAVIDELMTAESQ